MIERECPCCGERTKAGRTVHPKRGKKTMDAVRCCPRSPESPATTASADTDQPGTGSGRPVPSPLLEAWLSAIGNSVTVFLWPYSDSSRRNPPKEHAARRCHPAASFKSYCLTAVIAPSPLCPVAALLVIAGSGSLGAQFFRRSLASSVQTL